VSSEVRGSTPPRGVCITYWAFERLRQPVNYD